MDYSGRLQLLHFLYGIALADESTPPAEVQMIEQIAYYLGISQPDMQSIRAMFIKDTVSSYKILEIYLRMPRMKK
jgi:DnaJ like chaperone protein